MRRFVASGVTPGVIVLMLVALLTRIIILDARPMDHDEGVVAYLTYQLFKNGYYRYDPAFHGPFIYFATAALFKLFGDSEIVTRLLVVFFSLIGIFTALKMERWMGKGAWIFALVLIFSPSILYYSRYFRNDIIVLSSFLVVIYAYLRWVESEKERYVYLATLFFAIIMSSKENGYIYLATFLSFAFLYGIFSERGAYLKKKLLEWNLKKARICVISAIIFASIFVPLYSAGFADMDGVYRATIGGVEHWLSMHEQKDHWKPIYYYSKILLRYEFFTLAIAFAAIPQFWKRVRAASRFEYLAAYWSVTALIAYHILSHKVPWLLVHMVAPLAMFGSIYAGKLFDVWENRGFRLSLLIVFAAMLAVSIQINYINYNDAREDLIYIQVQPSAVELAERLKADVEAGKKVLVYEESNDYWPLPWYLRNVSVAFSSKYYSGYDVVVTSERLAEKVKEKGYSADGVYEIRPGYFMVYLARAT